MEGRGLGLGPEFGSNRTFHRSSLAASGETWKTPNMRPFVALAFVLVLTGCTPAYERIQQSYQSFEGERVDIRKYGESALDISVDYDGNGRFRINRWPKVEVGTFKLAAEQYADFRHRLDSFRQDAKPFDPANLEPGTNACEDGSRAISDTGGILVRWVEPGRDDILRVKLGCPMASTKQRDEQLWAFVLGYWNGFEENIKNAAKR